MSEREYGPFLYELPWRVCLTIALLNGWITWDTEHWLERRPPTLRQHRAPTQPCGIDSASFTCP